MILPLALYCLAASCPANPATIQSYGLATAFNQARIVQDEELSLVRGTSAAAMTIGTFRAILDTQRSDMRLASEVGRVEMDVWWGTTGSTLIANSVRNAGL